MTRVSIMRRTMAAFIMTMMLFGLPGMGTGEQMIEFNNKLAESGNDPWVVFQDEAYYYCWSGYGGVCVARVRNLPDIGDAYLLPENEKIQARLVWTPEDSRYSQEIWAPEMHFLDGKWYIYVAADDGNNDHHRMLCLEARTDDPLDGFVQKGIVRARNNRWAIDGTILEYGGKRYFIWSGWDRDENVAQNLYIAEMENPWTIRGNRVLISRPELPWECVGDPLVNEGPTALVLNGKVYIIYSASGSWTDDYCLGMLTLTGDDPLLRNAWTKSEQPVFRKTDQVFGPGHASFTTSPDGSRHYMAYHANEESGSSWGGRKLWVQEFTVDAQNDPVFGTPLPAGSMQTIPANGT